MQKKRLIVVACEVVRTEVDALASKSPHDIDIKYVDQGLHNVGKIKMPIELQKILDEIEQAKYDAILLFYGLCNNGVVGLRASIPIIIPRAHDCITFFLGSKEKYREYFDSHPGTYFFASGWNEETFRGNESLELEKMKQEYIDKYGEDNAEYLMEVLAAPPQHYKRLSFINTGTGSVDSYRASAKRFAEEAGWEFEEAVGETTLFQKFLNGEWDSDSFLTVPSGSTIQPSYRDDIIKIGEPQTK
ncbi:MAG: DUF1638 domain-containing protein [Eubacteriaceae bacterium]|jgi:hypothetical protein|nr:DUF1638 domain-containing protein [Eubacteriaceae bacterium]